MCVVRVHKYCCKRRKRGKLAKQAQGENETEKRSEERGRKKRKDTNTKGVEFDTIVCWRDTKKPNSKSRLFNLHTVAASQFEVNAQHHRREMVVGREKVSGKRGNAQSDVRVVQSKNERREIKQNSQSARERACVWNGCANTVAKGEGEGEAS